MSHNCLSNDTTPDIGSGKIFLLTIVSCVSKIFHSSDFKSMHNFHHRLHSPSMLAVEAKIDGVLYKQFLISRLFIGHHTVV